MAKSYSSPKMDSPTARTKNCKERHSPYWEVIRPGLYLGYRRGKKGGTWFAKIYDKNATPSRQQIDLGSADDNEKPDGKEVLDYEQATDKAKLWFKKKAQPAKESEGPKASYTVRDCMADYLSSYQKSGGKAVKDTDTTIKAHILPSLGDLQVTGLTRGRLQKWFENLAGTPARLRTSRSEEQQFKAAPEDDEAKRKRRSTANRILTVLKAALNRAVDVEDVTCPTNAWKLVKPFKKADGSRIRFLSVEDQPVFVQACGPELRKLVQGALFTGARYGELGRLLHVRDFNEQTGQIFITAETKNEESRYVVLSEEGIEFFKAMVKDRNKSERMFLAPGGTFWERGDQIRPVKRAVKKAEIEGGLTFHELRHTYASTLIMADIPLAVVAQQLGHKGTRMVDKHYGHLAKKYVTHTIRSLSPKLNITDPG